VTAADLAELEQLRTLAQGDTAMAIAFMSALDEHAEELLRLARVGLAAQDLSPGQARATGAKRHRPAQNCHFLPGLLLRSRLLLHR
jgi:hypothetical protein